MKINQAPAPAPVVAPFLPITIVLESEHEARALQTVLNLVPPLLNVHYCQLGGFGIHAVTRKLWGALDSARIQNYGNA